jgi:phosphatidylglycerol:prolipoprotein diacylglycerol transferase
MQQVLFRIPIKFGWFPDGIPVYGFGLMLFLAFILCTWLAGWRARKVGVKPELVQDLAIWVFVGGLLGARIVYMIQYGVPWSDFFKIWEGGIVFYGSLLGGAVGFTLAYFAVMRKQQLAWWKVADIVAPSLALGLCLGRIGCFLNGCCYGSVACPDCPAVHFPFSAPPRLDLARGGYQTAAGFTVVPNDERTVQAVEPGSAAATVGLKAGDVIVQADDQRVDSYDKLDTYLARNWPRGKNDLTLTVERGGQEVTLPAFYPQTLGLHPTQIYESISMGLLFLLLMAYYPLRRHDGEVIVLFLMLYPIHRFLNEMLRNDTDPVAFGMTLSQNGSILVIAVALVLAFRFWRRPAEYPATV